VVDGSCLSEQGRYGEAEHEAKELIGLAPNYGPAYAELGLVYQASRRYEDATEVFNKYLQLSPNNAASNSAVNPATPEGQQAQERPAQIKGN
jgi:tetratricopeptide (TPR) repeat protein